MITTREFILSPEEAFGTATLEKELYHKLGLPPDGEITVNMLKRSIDARGRHVVVRVLVEVGPKRLLKKIDTYHPDHLSYVGSRPHVVIVGCGPAGMFAALQLIEDGIKPVIIERGKDVRARRRDLADINKHHIVNPDSNYCFGEGGAGTYSDGKLYTRSTKRGDVKRVLEMLVAYGAPSDILFDAHPHIGTNRLPELIARMRETILSHGGEIHFGERVTDLDIQANTIHGVVTHTGTRFDAKQVVLATGHSARDIFQILYRRNVAIESKPFALGVRVEHPQSLIDQIQYHCPSDRGMFLPAASYALVNQVKEGKKQRGVFSFCMCPGGFIVPSATAPGEVVVNGMSPSRRDSYFANSGIVVATDEEDWLAFRDHGPLAGLFFQSEVEQNACKIAGNTQAAPAQRLIDFVDGIASSELLRTSYQPGLTSVKMTDLLPPFITRALRESFVVFGKKMKGYLTNEAQIVGVESRTSSPVKIPRTKETFEHIAIKGLFPCGEGAGYAGGIVSAALDGIASAKHVRQHVHV